MAAAILSCSLALGQTEKVLHSFGGIPSDGSLPIGSLTVDSHGNLFGVTYYGGASSGGTVFELSPNAGGSWNETILYNFCAAGGVCPGGTAPSGYLVLDGKGNLYGAAEAGGTACAEESIGCGVIYELSQNSDGSWTQTVVYSFCQTGDCPDGFFPTGKLSFDKQGNLYGSAEGGGAGGAGVVFRLTPGSNGVWTETALYSFCSAGGACQDGAGPPEGVSLDTNGNIYGTTLNGGSQNYGVIFKLSRGDAWAESVLYSFPAQPKTVERTYTGPVSVDPYGNVYTTATWELWKNQMYMSGDLYRVATNGTVSNYQFKGKYGSAPLAGVVIDAKRQLAFGTTSQIEQDAGNVFQIASGGRATVLYTFCHQIDCADGKYPNGLAEDASGDLYGSTEFGGTSNQGVVYEITP